MNPASAQENKDVLAATNDFIVFTWFSPTLAVSFHTHPPDPISPSPPRHAPGSPRILLVSRRHRPLVLPPLFAVRATAGGIPAAQHRCLPQLSATVVVDAVVVDDVSVFVVVVVVDAVVDDVAVFVVVVVVAAVVALVVDAAVVDDVAVFVVVVVAVVDVAVVDNDVAVAVVVAAAVAAAVPDAVASSAPEGGGGGS